MKTRVIILAGGAGTRLGALTAKRTKPAVPFAGKYRIIDFALSNCVNSGLYDVSIVTQYRPHSLIEHIGAGSSWDLNRDFSGGVRFYNPYQASTAGWFVGTADAIQQNYKFIKRNNPDLILILSGDHIYNMDYTPMIDFHLQKGASLTIGTIEVPKSEASRFGIVGVDNESRITTFVEKPQNPPSNLANMGVYLFEQNILDSALWADHLRQDSSHDFGKDVIPHMIGSSNEIFAYPYPGYWVDVGTAESYWQAHMDLLEENPALNMYDRSWIIHTRTEERPPARIIHGAQIANSLICDGCHIESGASVTRSILSPGVRVESGAVVNESIVLTDAVINKCAKVERAVIDKRVVIGEETLIGAVLPDALSIAMVGKNSIIPARAVVQAGGMVGTDVIPEDFPNGIVKSGEIINTRRKPHEV
jgi:glucose-1-phosphate adenylyltransferase